MLRGYGWPRNNPYSFEELGKKFAASNIVLSKNAFEIAVQFDDIVGSFGNLHKKMRFDILHFLGSYEGYAIGETSSIVGKDLIPFAHDADSYLWLVAPDGNVYTDWSGIVCLQGNDIISALEGALTDYEGIRVDTGD